MHESSNKVISTRWGRLCSHAERNSTLSEQPDIRHLSESLDFLFQAADSPIFSKMHVRV